ncbi:hypothetical protein GWK47_008409 [Chionoecetes opilio]|uniref:Uncharacterized protein n=1 Tax=Chionoecetes opilio TaxID=41210 RepID=A0A8J4XZQ0_CHIOP|nr:hypothetical protein GWK47_008409 [Chionoecetes opilio]
MVRRPPNVVPARLRLGYRPVWQVAGMGRGASLYILPTVCDCTLFQHFGILLPQLSRCVVKAAARNAALTENMAAPAPLDNGGIQRLPRQTCPTHTIQGECSSAGAGQDITKGFMLQVTENAPDPPHHQDTQLPLLS